MAGCCWKRTLGLNKSLGATALAHVPAGDVRQELMHQVMDKEGVAPSTSGDENEEQEGACLMLDCKSIQVALGKRVDLSSRLVDTHTHQPAILHLCKCLRDASTCVLGDAHSWAPDSSFSKATARSHTKGPWSGEWVGSVRC